jgi:hypothetical protein
MKSLISGLKFIEAIESLLEKNPSGPNPKARAELLGASGALVNMDNTCLADRGRKITKLAEKYYGPQAVCGQFPHEITGMCQEVRMEISATERHLSGETL